MRIRKYLAFFILTLTLVFTPNLFLSRPAVSPLALASEKAKAELCAGKNVCVARVKRIIDGDTFVLSTGEKVRYIGINAPEIAHYLSKKPAECFGKEATEEDKKLLEGKEVKLVKDISDKDKFGRLLRYVYASENGKEMFINDYLVRNGFARAPVYPPDVKYKEEFQEAEKEAKENKKGLWAKGACANFKAGESKIDKNKSDANKKYPDYQHHQCQPLLNNFTSGLLGFILGALLTVLGIWEYGKAFKK